MFNDKRLRNTIWVAVCSILFALNTEAQSNDDTVFKNVVVATSNSNVLYIGKPNPINFAAKGYSGEIVPSIQGPGILTKDSNGQYSVTILNMEFFGGRQCKILLWGKKKNGSLKYLGSEKFIIKWPLPPTCYVANKKGYFSVTEHDLSIITQVQARYDDGSDISATVRFFNMKIYKKDGTTTRLRSESQYFTQEMKDQFKELTKGDIIIIEGVNVRGINANTIDGVVMTVSD